MTYSEIRKFIEEEFNNNWTTTPLVWENISSNIQNKEWIRITIITTNSYNRTLGDNKSVKKGFLVVQIFTPLNEGLGSAYATADAVLSLMENRRFTDLFLYAGAVEQIGESPTTSFNPAGSGQFRQLTPGFYQLNVKIPFEAL